MKKYIDIIKNFIIDTWKKLKVKDYIIIAAYLTFTILLLIFIKKLLIKIVLVIVFTIGMFIYYYGGYIMRKKNKKKNTKNKTWKKVLIVLLILGIIGILAFGAFCTYIVLTTKSFNPNKLTYNQSSIIYDKNGNEIVTLGINQNDEVEKRKKITYNDLPQVLVDALIATEDSRFFQHNGVDLARFIKASIYQLLGSDAGGASTITMQVSKNNFTDITSTGLKGIIRKFRDIYISVFQIEKKYTKEEIIEFYFNDNLLGGINYGVEQASEYYFGKSAKELSLPEAALLVGMYQSPNAYNPYNHPEAATKRRKTVLNLMVRHGYITKEQADVANSIPVESLLKKGSDTTTTTNKYQGYIDMVIEEVEAKTNKNPYTTSMKIYTTLDTSMQTVLDDMMSGKTYTWDTETVQAGVAIVNVNTGEINAIGAGRNKSGGFNLATRSQRHPGSTAKPLFDYAPGIEYENWSTYTLFNDEPWAYSNGVEVGNWDSKFNGLMTMKQALSVSRNIPALKTFQQLKKKDVINFVTSLGIKPEIESNSLHEAHAIGGFTGVSPLQMASAYAAFANGGYYIEPHSVTKVEFVTNNETKTFKYKKTRVMADSTAYLITNMLEYAVNHGFNGGAKVSGMAVAAKTGTSNFSSDDIKKLGLSRSAIPDLWTVAYTPEYSVALWYGYEKADAQNHLKSSASAPKDKVMRSVMTAIPKTDKKFTIPNSVTKSKVEWGTWPAQLPSDYTPSAFVMEEWFVKGTEPTEVSERFSKLSDVTNLEAKYNNTTNEIKLTWNHTTPTVLSTSYLTSFYNQYVFGNQSQNYLNERLSYNQNTLGDIGYGVYKKNTDGSLTSIGFTTDKNYTYKVPSDSNGELSLVVKVEYKNFKSNTSSGSSVNTKVSSSGTTTSGVIIDLVGSKTLNLALNSDYNEPNPGITIKEDNKDIYSKCVVTITVQKGSTTTTVTTNNKIEDIIDTSATGTYYIKYTATYNEKTYNVTRTINIANS